MTVEESSGNISKVLNTGMFMLSATASSHIKNRWSAAGIDKKTDSQSRDRTPRSWNCALTLLRLICHGPCCLISNTLSCLYSSYYSLFMHNLTSLPQINSLSAFLCWSTGNYRYIRLLPLDAALIGWNLWPSSTRDLLQ